MKNLWEKFERGDHLTDEEIVLLIKNTRGGIEFLQNRPDCNIVFRAVIHDLNRLEMCAKARNIKL